MFDCLKKHRIEKLKASIENSKKVLSDAVDTALINAETDINAFRNLLEQSKNYGVDKHIHFFNLNIHTSVAYTDMVLLAERLRLADRRLEKVMYSRLLSMIMIEFLDDINRFIGKEFLKELERNNHNSEVEYFKSISKQYSTIKSENGAALRALRNSTAAHKEDDALKLLNLMYNINSSEISQIAVKVIEVTGLLVRQTTSVMEKILEDIRRLPK